MPAIHRRRPHDLARAFAPALLLALLPLSPAAREVVRPSAMDCGHGGVPGAMCHESSRPDSPTLLRSGFRHFEESQCACH